MVAAVSTRDVRADNADIEGIMFGRLRSQVDREDGFTLVELMIAIAILGIILAVSIPVYSNVQRQAKITRLKADVTDSAAQASAYYKQYAQWPDATTFASRVAVLSANSNDQLSFNTPPGGAGTGLGDVYNVCIQGSLALDATTTVTYSYNLMARKLIQGACTYVAPQSQETAANN